MVISLFVCALCAFYAAARAGSEKNRGGAGKKEVMSRTRNKMRKQQIKKNKCQIFCKKVICKAQK